ncbi:hypothetical protein BZG36_03036 [Bifiguratus adelaidae]|uniref:Inhibitor I9 domain-containing protein n=1 Tax=Bifiguratus adelaidae TaxID=1938954 RepID=A0A261XYY6_9FUNG|nr:hypothetical protein BZG36_03036 [Bifiguratus adelaidae]
MADKQGKYIVVYKKGTPPDIIDQHAQDVEKQGKWGAVKHKYKVGLLGFAATLPDNTLSTFAENEHIDYIEPDGEVTTYGKTVAKGKQ